MGDDVKFGGKIRMRYTASGFVLNFPPFCGYCFFQKRYPSSWYK